jgi:hypothetical protein
MGTITDTEGYAFGSVSLVVTVGTGMACNQNWFQYAHPRTGCPEAAAIAVAAILLSATCCWHYADSASTHSLS